MKNNKAFKLVILLILFVVALVSIIGACKHKTERRGDAGLFLLG